jgi:hypothetical protein
MSLQSQIDNAFYNALNQPSHDTPGGFFLDDSPGGFLPPSPPTVEQPERDEARDEESSYIPLSRIPHALQLLDLSPDDEEVLAVFRNAATGWEDDYPSSRHKRQRGPSTTSKDNEAIEGHVSLRDWRAVCAALMDDGGDDEDDGEGSAIDDNENNRDVTGAYLSSELEESSGGSSDEYRITEASPRKRSRKSAAATGSDGGVGVTRKARARKTQSAAVRRRSPLSPSASVEITPRQRRECLQAFLLFFPDVPEEVATRGRLGVREVNAAATSLNEKIKTEEVRALTLGLSVIGRMTCLQIIEMLEAFSTSPDKTMSLSDFEKMMIATRLA